MRAASSPASRSMRAARARRCSRWRCSTRASSARRPYRCRRPMRSATCSRSATRCTAACPMRRASISCISASSRPRPLVLIPGSPLGLLTEAVQTLAGVLLPSATVFLLVLCNDRQVLGPWVNSTKLNVFTGAVIWVLVLLSIILTASVMYPDISGEAIVDAGAWRHRARDHGLYRHGIDPPQQARGRAGRRSLVARHVAHAAARHARAAEHDGS